jgi:hypothetical protein
MPRRVPPLSVKTLASVRAGNKPIELVDGYVPGLRVRVLPSGTRAWSLNIRDSKGIRRRFDVGSGLSLSAARRTAEDLRRAIRGGGGSDDRTARCTATGAGRQRRHRYASSTTTNILYERPGRTTAASIGEQAAG